MFTNLKFHVNPFAVSIKVSGEHCIWSQSQQGTQGSLYRSRRKGKYRCDLFYVHDIASYVHDTKTVNLY